jgi:hypothetical protein
MKKNAEGPVVSGLPGASSGVGAHLLDPARTVTSAHERPGIQQGSDMTQSIPENSSIGDWSFVTVASNALPPRDPNEDDDNDEADERDTESDDEREPAVIREPDEDE